MFFFLLTFKKKNYSALRQTFSFQYEFLINFFFFFFFNYYFFYSILFATYNFFKTVRFLKMSSVIELNEQLEIFLGKNRTVSKNGNRHKFEF